ncbi:hypothetical protein H3N56_09645 [Cetobacterium sp. 2A]|uniref:hypothetical protein n=1 Tax=Cetobacterium sp. 2A TaxID=2754723 RepID=UPI00163D17E6|nr:hypothetical protein [Cetobacterium sp. 2A]MBC2856704.1 hypothetical protein [Cetobacterium sp. 2A]
MLKIFNDKVYGLDESLIASGYPMVGSQIESWEDEITLNEKDYKRASKLGNVPTGTGHDNFLKGIIVQFDITYPNYWTPQFQRYHFADIVSSTSKMHRLIKMDLKASCNEYVDDAVIEILQKWIDIFNSFIPGQETIEIENKIYSKYEIYMKVISNCPMGLEQTMRVTTSYLQLKTIYQQRRHHKLKEDWGNFCDWCLTLPHFEEFCLNNIK